ncbi:alpha/beta hydrolase [Cytobacillus purgationiresistens]|uniref:Alpha-beta hydrolase superfamily lysophospholipase n=1 Tax=Cytobacillus purgationiresistens TaxID=863449 RepID=A0ABU0AF41_9BACI|nr:alpha/beta hydrolase [Cytobacillus purgationiresistens]MDQ0269331.1 alpha-beta hydrolase superfamily lysophospholipase [Cytobacillus purgationiresistens]
MKKFCRYIFLPLLLLLSIGVFFTNKLMYIRKKGDQVIFDRESTSGRFDAIAYEDLSKEEFLLPSSLGYEIKTVLAEPHKHKRYMVIAHGVTENKTNSIKYMNMFLQRGFNVVIYDHRRHGESGGKTTSYGYYEKFDLKVIVDWLRALKGEDIQIGIHGESMGAVTTLLYGGMVEDGADFYIADCPFSDLREQLTHHLKTSMKLPPKLLLPVGNLFLRVRDKYSIKDVSPIAVIDSIEKPILFIHSKNDRFILPEMTKALYERKRGPKKLFIAENGFHAQSYNENREEYEQVIDEFLVEYGLAGE